MSNNPWKCSIVGSFSVLASWCPNLKSISTETASSSIFSAHTVSYSSSPLLKTKRVSFCSWEILLELSILALWLKMVIKTFGGLWLTNSKIYILMDIGSFGSNISCKHCFLPAGTSNSIKKLLLYFNQINSSNSFINLFING